MHDIADLESLGLPGVFVASTEFEQAAQAQSLALGFPSMQRVFVAHPIQDRSDDEMVALADEVFERLLSCIVIAD